MVWIRADKKRQGEKSPERKIGIKDRTPLGGVKIHHNNVGIEKEWEVRDEEKQVREKDSISNI